MPRWLRIGLLVVVAVVVLVLLFTVVFPWVEQRTQDPTIAAAVAAVFRRPALDRYRSRPPR